MDAEDPDVPEEDLEDELDEDLEDDLDEDVPLGDDDDVVVDDDEDDDAPAATRKPADDDEDDDDELDPDDVEADLDAILKDRIAAGVDEDDEEEVAEDRNDPDATERVAAKSAEEFTCETCFMIVHPRQFGRLGRLTCPEGYDPCPSVALVEKRLKKAARK
jgi:hypothetical protein